MKRWNGLWRRGVGTFDDPDNGRLIFRLTGINAIIYSRKADNWPARFRMLYWLLVRRYKYEICHHCGRPVKVVFHVPDEIWEIITGNARSYNGEAGAGILCAPCVSILAKKAALPFLRWTCTTDDRVLYG